MAEKVKLKIAIAEFPHTSAIRSGAIPIEGVDAEFVTVQPQIGAFRRMVRQLEFDVCELAPTTFIIARSYGLPVLGLPVFVTRRFHHSGLLVRPDAGVRTPRDLEGKKVGVRAYSVTTGVWTRSILIDEFGVDNSKVTWVVDDEEHVQQLKLPPNVVHVNGGSSLAAMMEAGELAGGFEGAAGIGRTGSPAATGGPTGPRQGCATASTGAGQDGSRSGLPRPIHHAHRADPSMGVHAEAVIEAPPSTGREPPGPRPCAVRL